MGLSPLQCVCFVLMGAILAVWMDDEGSRHPMSDRSDAGAAATTTTFCDYSSSYSNILSYAIPANTIGEVGPGVVRLEDGSDLEYNDDDDDSSMSDASWQPPQRNSTLNGLLAQNFANMSNNNLNATSSAASKYSPILNYLRDPERFIQTVQDCATDPHCHIMYQHVSKTGGTTVEQALFPLFDLPTVSTCCHQRLRQQFWENTEHYCAAKFSSWQMFEDEFKEVVGTCQDADPLRRTLVLTTFREPTATLLSYIHQMCNKNINKRKPVIREACTACTYENATALWHSFSFIIERQIAGSYRVSRWLRQDYDAVYEAAYNTKYRNKSHTSVVFVDTSHIRLDPTRLQILTLETNDVDSFLWHWQPEAIFHVANSEHLGYCEFSLTTELIKSLRPSLSIYRKLLAGL